MKHIHIGSVKIPFDDYVTQGTAILGIRGAGKTYTAKGIAEQMLDAKVPIIVFDAIGVWRYLKIAADAQGKSYKVVVAGGKQPDLLLSPHSAPQIIRAALRENIPLIVDLYDTKLSKADWRRIVQECFRIMLYENQGLRHIFLEEAAEYVPQKIMDGQTFAEVEKLVRMGGNASIGITMINQRSQELNKSVLELCDNLVMMRQKGFNAIAYAEKWAERLSPDQAKQIGAKLPKMEAGDCWVFTDANDDPVFTKSDQIQSFHPDRKRPEHPKNSSIADPTEFVQKLSSELVHVIEEAKANDPQELKRKLQEAERKLRIAQQKEPETQQSEPISILTDLDRKQIQRAIEVSSGVVNTIEKENGKLVDCIADIRTFLKRVEEALNRAAPKQDRSRPRIVVEPKHSFQPPKWKAVETNGKLGKCESAILGVLDRHGDSNIGRLSLLAGYTQSGSFKNALSALRMQGLIVGSNDQTMSITELGSQQGPFPQLPDTANERFEYWKSFAHFGKCEKEILQVLFDADEPLHINEIANRACYEVPVSGSFKNSLSTLRTAGVLIGKNDEAMGLNPDLFT